MYNTAPNKKGYKRQSKHDERYNIQLWKELLDHCNIWYILLMC